MKTFSLVLLSLLLFVSSLHAKYVPTPEMAMAFDYRGDKREWRMDFMDGNRDGIISELVPKGQSVKAWKEMVAHQIVFTKKPLREFVDTWKAGLKKADAAAEMKEMKNDDGSITVSYSSIKANEAGIRRFIKASDGIYMLAYHVRPELKNQQHYDIWAGIIAKSKLIPNPERRR